MIGRSAGRTGAASARPASIRETIEDGWNRFRERAVDLFRTVTRLVTRTVQVARWVLEQLAIIEPVEWFRWETRRDERTCPECGPLDGRRWPETSPAPSPPLHVNCRCQVVHDHTEWRVRHIPTWQRRVETRTSREWVRTGWA